MEPGGFKLSPIKLNHSLINLDTWNEETIKNRAEDLFKKAMKIWPYPEFDETTLDSFKNNQTDKKTYNISDHEYLTFGSPMYSIFEELRKRIINIESSVTEEPTKLYVAYKNISTFASIIGLKSSIKIILNLPFNEIEDPKGICEDITKKGHWGIGDTRF
jgi:predicted transport protein